MSKALAPIAAAMLLAACSLRQSATETKSGQGSDLNGPRPMPLLTRFFQENCTTCHGINGDEGHAPVLSGLDYDFYRDAVRGGHPAQGVPAFHPEDYPDAELNADYTAINGRPAVSSGRR